MKPQTTRVSLTINVWSYFYFWHTCFPANGQVLQNSTIYEIQDWIILDGLEGGATYSLELFTLYGSVKDNPIRSVPSNFTFVASELLKCYFCFTVINNDSNFHLIRKGLQLWTERKGSGVTALNTICDFTIKYHIVSA